jgi:hypothetical protein
MSNDNTNMNDPLNFMRNMWGNMGLSMPGMVAPTFDVDELDKRIKDMKAVEGWLRMNLSMLQMTIQGLEMQRTTLGAVQAMGQMASDAAKSMKPEAAAESPLRSTPPIPPFRSRHVALADDAADARTDAAIGRSGNPGGRRQPSEGGSQEVVGRPPHVFRRARSRCKAQP